MIFNGFDFKSQIAVAFVFFFDVWISELSGTIELGGDRLFATNAVSYGVPRP